MAKIVAAVGMRSLLVLLPDNSVPFEAGSGLCESIPCDFGDGTAKNRAKSGPNWVRFGFVFGRFLHSFIDYKRVSGFVPLNF